MSETPAQNIFQNPRSLWLINALMFQLGWFVCVLGGSIWAVVFTVTALAVHWVLLGGITDKITIGICLLVGWVHDSSLAAAGVMIFTDGDVVSPVWLWCLWILMGMTLNHSLSWVYRRPWISAVLGSISGPLAYAGGIALSDAEWGVPLPEAFAIMAPVWLLVLPSIRFIAHRIDLLCR